MAEIKPHYSETRTILADVIPLDMPYSVQVEVSQYCNLKCNYCMQSFIPQKNQRLMDMDTFAILCARVGAFERPLKQVNFAGWGEPLTNPLLPQMIQHLKETGVTNNIAIVTNGIALGTGHLAGRLVWAGVDHIRISLQGMTGKKYQEVSGRKINFPGLVASIRHLYAIKESCKVSVKIADIALEPGEEHLFYDTFGPITDQMYIESIRPMFHENKQDGKVISKYGIDHPPVITCPMPFYMMSVTATGEIFPCCHYYKPITLGNIKTHSLKAAWESKEMRDLWKMLLDGGRLSNHNYPVCRDCLMPDAILTPGDFLDDRAEEIKRRLM